MLSSRSAPIIGESAPCDKLAACRCAFSTSGSSSPISRARRFYGEALGLEEIPRPSNVTFAGVWFRFGDDELHLLAEAHTTGGAGRDAGEGTTRGLTHHLAFEVDDLDAACARLAGEGIPLAGGPMPRGDGVTQVFFLDPDGYVLEYFQRTGEDQSNAPARAPVTRAWRPPSSRCTCGEGYVLHSARRIPGGYASPPAPHRA